MIRRPNPALLTAALLLAAASAHAMPLTQLWDAAQAHAPALQSARAARDAGKSRGDQASALWRPDILVSASAGYGHASTSTQGAQFSAPNFGASDDARFDTDLRQARSDRWNVALTQPIYSPQRSAQRSLLNIAAASADQQWLDARQALMLRVTQAYFALALSEQALRVLQRQQQAVDRILAETRDRYALGDAPIIDTHEAQARADALRAQALAAQTDLDLRRTELTDLTGVDLAPGAARLPQALQQMQADTPLQDWQAQAIEHNPQLRLMEQQLAAAGTEASRHGAFDDAQLNLVASVGGENMRGNGQADHAANRSRQAWVGVQFQLPLSTSGLRSAQKREALHLQDKVRADRDLARQQVALQVRSAWLGLTAGSARVQALQSASAASQQRLAATRTGKDAGDRTTLDLLNAENDEAAAQLSLDQARVQWLLDRMRLDALAGRLDERSLEWAWQQTQARASRLPSCRPAIRHALHDGLCRSHDDVIGVDFPGQEQQ